MPCYLHLVMVHRICPRHGVLRDDLYTNELKATVGDVCTKLKKRMLTSEPKVQVSDCNLEIARMMIMMMTEFKKRHSSITLEITWLYRQGKTPVEVCNFASLLDTILSLSFQPVNAAMVTYDCYFLLYLLHCTDKDLSLVWWIKSSCN